MIALSLWQPWSSLVIIGAKKIETRSWPWPKGSRLPCRIAIHAAKKWTGQLEAMCRKEPFCAALKEAGFTVPWPGEDYRVSKTNLPRGVLLGTVEVVDCIAVEMVTVADHVLPGNAAMPHAGGYYVSAQEHAFGDYGPGRWAWLLRDPRPLLEPIPYRGRQGLWEIEDPRPRPEADF